MYDLGAGRYLNFCLMRDGQRAGQIVEVVRTLTGAELDALLRGYLADAPPLVAPPPVFGQRNPPHGARPYTAQSDMTFGQAGCFVCALTSLVKWAGYDADPIEVARALDERGAFDGAELLHPELLSAAYPMLGAYQRIDWPGPANTTLLRTMLQWFPVVVQIDFQASWALEPHFMLAYEYIPDPSGGRDDGLMVMDPWDGAYLNAANQVEVNAAGKRASGGYFWPEWWAQPDMDGTQKTRVERLLWGARLFEVGEHVP